MTKTAPERQSFNESLFEPFSVFEEYMLADDSPQYPMDPVFQLRFRGVLNRQAARDALRCVVERHPLLQSLAVKKRGRVYWRHTSQPPKVRFVDFDADPDVPGIDHIPSVNRIDLTKEPGFRVCHIASRKENWSRLILQFHHSVMDGLGFMRVLSEWLVVYARDLGLLSSNTTLSEIKPEALKERRKTGWNLRIYLRNYFHTWRTTNLLVFGVPRSLVPVGAFKDVVPQKDFPQVRTLRLTKEETETCVRHARSFGVTVNDLLLTNFFLTMDKWLTDVKHDRVNGRMRVMAPVNARTQRHRYASVSNVVSTVFVDRSRRRIARGRESLMKSVSQEMKWVKKWEQHVVFLLVLHVLRWVPMALKGVLRLPVSRSTGVLSNLGRVLEDSPLERDADGRLKLGDLTLESIEAEAPIRHKTALSVVGLTYAGELNLCFHYDSRLIAEEELGEFLRIFSGFLF